MAVIGHPGAKTQRGHARKRLTQFAAHVQALADHVHHRHLMVGVLMVVVMLFVVVAIMAAAMQVVAMGVAAFEVVAVAGQAVARGLAGVGRTQIALRTYPRQAQAAGVAAIEAAAHARSAGPAAAHAVVVGIARQAFDMHRDRARAAGQRERSGLLPGAAAVAQLGAALIAFFGNPGGNLVVEDVDHAAHRAAAVDQRRRTAQHFDLRGQHGLHGDRMVGADGRGIVQFGAVAEDLDARSVHAADDGAARARAEMAGMDAGLGAERFAQRGFAAQHQFLAFKNAGGRGHLAARLTQAAGRDRDFGEHAFTGLGRHGLGRCQA